MSSSFSCSSVPVASGFVVFQSWKPSSPLFKDRLDAGHQLGQKLISEYGDRLKDALYLGCVRGGVVIAQGIREEMYKNDVSCHLDSVIVRKVSVPDHKEFGVGAMTETGDVIFLDDLVDKYKVDTHSASMQEHVRLERIELARRQKVYRETRSQPSLLNRKVVIVDDGIAGGSTMIAAIKSVQQLSQNTANIMIAIPISSGRAERYIRDYTQVDPSCFCVIERPDVPSGHSWNIDDFYEKFEDVSDDQVKHILLSAYRA